jgi:hypothetical protein
MEEYMLRAVLIDDLIGVFNEVLYKQSDECNPVDTGHICSAHEVKARLK